MAWFGSATLLVARQVADFEITSFRNANNGGSNPADDLSLEAQVERSGTAVHLLLQIAAQGFVRGQNRPL
jgi:hypothetical protein